MNNTSRSIAPEYATAFRSAKAAKNFCLLAIFAALALQLTGMFMIRFADVLDPIEAVEVVAAPAAIPAALTIMPTTMPAAGRTPTTMPAAGGVSADMTREVARSNAVLWREYLTWTMDATKAMAPIICVLLVLAVGLAVLLSLVGRLGGVAGLTSALFWSLVLLIMLTPWQQLFAGRFACGAMYSLNELITQTRTIEPAWGASNITLLSRSIYYVRFLGLGVLAMLVWATVLVKFAIGQSHMTMPVPITSVPTAPALPEDDYEATE